MKFTWNNSKKYLKKWGYIYYINIIYNTEERTWNIVDLLKSVQDKNMNIFLIFSRVKNK